MTWKVQYLKDFRKDKNEIRTGPVNIGLEQIIRLCLNLNLDSTSSRDIIEMNLKHRQLYAAITEPLRRTIRFTRERRLSIMSPWDP